MTIGVSDEMAFLSEMAVGLVSDEKTGGSTITAGSEVLGEITRGSALISETIIGETIADTGAPSAMTFGVLSETIIGVLSDEKTAGSTGGKSEMIVGLSGGESEMIIGLSDEIPTGSPEGNPLSMGLAEVFQDRYSKSSSDKN